MFIEKETEKQILEMQTELRRLKEYRKKSPQEKMNLVYETYKKYDRGLDLYEPYDPMLFETKTKVDKMYYSVLLSKLDNNLVEGTEQIFKSLYDTVNKIYEHINIVPELYGNNIKYDIINESITNSNSKIKDVLNAYFKANFYNLSVEDREKRFFENHKELAKNLIHENINEKEAIKFSVVTRIVEGLLRSIAFPFSSWSRINYLLENSEYGVVFDQDVLSDHVDIFEKKLFNMSKIVATCFIQ